MRSLDGHWPTANDGQNIPHHRGGSGQNAEGYGQTRGSAGREGQGSHAKRLIREGSEGNRLRDRIDRQRYGNTHAAVIGAGGGEGGIQRVGAAAQDSAHRRAVGDHARDTPCGVQLRGTQRRAIGDGRRIGPNQGRSRGLDQEGLRYRRGRRVVGIPGHRGLHGYQASAGQCQQVATEGRLSRQNPEGHGVPIRWRNRRRQREGGIAVSAVRQGGEGNGLVSLGDGESAHVGRDRVIGQTTPGVQQRGDNRITTRWRGGIHRHWSRGSEDLNAPVAGVGHEQAAIWSQREPVGNRELAGT